MKKSLLFLLSIFTLLVFVSCGSKPEAETTTQPEAPVVEEVTEELSEEQQKELLAQIDEARNKAIEAGAEDKAPKQLQEIDAYYDSVKGDSKSLKTEGFKVAGLYNFLTDYIKAKDAKQEIDDNNFANYAQNNYQIGCDKLAAVEAAYEDVKNMNEQDALNAQEARANFFTVLTVAYKKLAKEERSLAYAEKKNADSVKAGVAQRTRYKAAVENFQKGDQLYAMQAAKKAIDSYRDAKIEFAALYKEVGEKRAVAQAAIDAAKKAVEESNNFAANADAEAPITGENIAGIEEEDAVLLEEDNYANPEDSEIDVAETFEEAVVETATEFVDDAVNNPEAAAEKVTNATDAIVDEVTSGLEEK